MSARGAAYRALRELYVSHQGAVAPWDKGCSHCGKRMEKVMAAVDAFAATYAHELAEKIRTELAERVSERLAGGIWEIRTVSTAQQAADLIDPEKESSK